MQPPTEINDFLSIAGQITRADIGELATNGVATIINNRPDNEEWGQLSAADARKEAEQRGLRYHFIPVTSGNIGLAEVTAFRDAVLKSPQPVLAHCRSGTRCYLLWSAARALFDGESPATLVAEAAGKGYDLRVLGALVEKLKAER